MSVQVPFSSSCTDSSSAPDRGHGVPRNWPYSDEYASAYRSVYSDMNAVTAIDAVELGDRSTSSAAGKSPASSYAAEKNGPPPPEVVVSTVGPGMSHVGPALSFTENATMNPFAAVGSAGTGRMKLAADAPDPPVNCAGMNSVPGPATPMKLITAPELIVTVSVSEVVSGVVIHVV